MDYLDPNKKKAHRTRLFLGYALIAVAIAIATVILVYVGSGYYIDRQTGDLIQNGQIYVNSDPEGASVYLNDKLQRAKTASKLVVPSGSYGVALKRDGYRDWIQQVQLEGGKVQRLDYALLIPSVLKPAVVQTFATVPTDVSQSNDRRFMSLVFADKPSTVLFYDETKPDLDAKVVLIDKALFSDPTKVGSLVVKEWTEDTKKVLIENRVAGVVLDYLLISRVDGDPSVNLTKTLKLKDVSIGLKEGASDSYFIFSKTAKTLGAINLNDKVLVPRLSGVLQYKAYNNDIIAYITDTGATKDKVQARLTDGVDKNYLLRELPAGATSYLLDISKVGSTSVLAVGASAENKVAVYRNPIGYLKANPNKTLPLATTILQLENPTEVSFSTDGSIIMARGGQKIASHYFEEDRTARFVVSLPLGSERLRWTDGKHLQAVSGGSAYIFDFDGANLQKLTDTPEQFSVYFDSNYRSLYSFSNTAKPFTMSRTLIKIVN